MKTCSLCKKSLSLRKFNKRPDRPGQYQSKCIECNKSYQREHYKKNKSDYMLKNKKYKEENRKRVRNIKESNPCVDCGYFYHFCQMDFDHVKNKSFEISRMYTYSWKAIKREIAKCELVCANCHRLRTFERKSDIVKLAGL